MYRVFKSPKFDKKVEKLLSSKELNELDKLIEKLKSDQFIEKPLNYEFFREYKIGVKRIYFLVYEDIAIILLVNSSNKKYQQETIDEIKLLLNEFKQYAYELYNSINKKN